jgi:hypothetical protein
LRNGVFEQHDKLIERLDLALKLDAVYEVYGYLNALFSECVEVRVL